jgi:hypothetical protein
MISSEMMLSASLFATLTSIVNGIGRSGSQRLLPCTGNRTSSPFLAADLETMEIAPGQVLRAVPLAHFPESKRLMAVCQGLEDAAFDQVSERIGVS